MESSYDAALKEGPEAFDGLCMNRADDVLLGGVIDDGCGNFLLRLL